MEQLIRNEAGGFAYEKDAAKALALYSVTGCLTQTFYTSAEMQLAKVLELCEKADPELVAKIAVYSRKYGYMKEMPALLTVWLAKKCADFKNDTVKFKLFSDLFQKVFNEVIDNGKMLRNFVKHLNSGVTGRKSLGHLPRRMVANWFNSRTNQEVFKQSVGNDPSFKAILKLTHPVPLDKSRCALYQWLLNRKYNEQDLPDIVKSFEDFKKGKTKQVPKVPFEIVKNFVSSPETWVQVVLNENWHWTRMNLNTLSRNKVFDLPEMTDKVAERLSDRETIKNARVFPYQLLTAYKNIVDVPFKVKEALQDALEIATENVPELEGNGYILVDVSGSMIHPVTGNQWSASTKVRCVDVAGLLGSVILRKNPSSVIIPFCDYVKEVSLNARDTVITNATKLADMIKGATDCSAPLKHLNDKNAKGDWVFLISDNQSWVSSMGHPSRDRDGKIHTEFMTQWDLFKQRNPNAKLICLDIQPYETSQSQERSDIIQVGGFSDAVFTIAELFVKDQLTAEHWLDVINQIEI